jgi:hypothetical protein
MFQRIYLSNLFDVFGESAVLKAKKTFEDNGCKWGKRLKKKLFIQADVADVSYVLKNLYIDVPEIDYIEMNNDELLWHLSKHGNSSVNNGFGRFHSRFYDIKTSWLDCFIKSFTTQYSAVFEKKDENDSEIITAIDLKGEVT